MNDEQETNEENDEEETENNEDEGMYCDLSIIQSCCSDYEIETFSVFPLNYRNTSESLEKREVAVGTQS